ncbi:MAG: hypothetical protein NZ561_10295, partial [Phycisphaerae bacterium]|nr:hypothetical protein [Phycisphaerae bacterium]
MARTVVMFTNPIAGRGKATAVSRQLQDALGHSYHIEHVALPAESVNLDKLGAVGNLEAAICV